MTQLDKALDLASRQSTEIQSLRSKLAASESYARAQKGLVDAAVAVLQRHILPDGGLSDHDAMSELYGIFDGPEYRAALAANPDNGPIPNLMSPAVGEAKP